MMIKLWEVATGKELRSNSEHSSIVASVAFSPDGLTILSGSWDGTVKLRQVATWAELRTFKDFSLIHSVAFSPDRRTALSGHSDKTLKLWDLKGP
jgi:WD40 repeat protein